MSLEKPWNFLLTKEKTWKSIFNSNSEISQNRTEKQIMPLKTTVNYLLCYSVIGCLNWKIGVFQLTVVRVYNIFNLDLNKQTKKVYFSKKSNNKRSLDITLTNTKVVTCSAQKHLGRLGPKTKFQWTYSKLYYTDKCYKMIGVIKRLSVNLPHKTLLRIYIVY